MSKTPATDDLSALAETANINRKVSIFKHRKKQAASDAQLLMNRIALLQKEEERARKKIDDTKDRATEIIHMRGENEKRMRDYLSAGNAEQLMREELQRKVKENDAEGRKARQEIHGNILNKRREEAAQLLNQKKLLTKFMLKEQEMELKLKQKKRDEGASGITVCVIMYVFVMPCLATYLRLLALHSAHRSRRS